MVCAGNDEEKKEEITKTKDKEFLLSPGQCQNKT